MGPPDAAPWLHRSLYDDYDVTAMALRGLNAERGRKAGAAVSAADYRPTSSTNRWTPPTSR